MVCAASGCDSILGLDQVSPIDAAPPCTSYRKAIAITQDGTTTLQDVPVSIVLASDHDLATHAQADGRDLVFTDGSGTELPAEIVAYSAGSLEAWVDVPALPSGMTTIYLDYGGAARTGLASAAWPSEFVGVWHLGGSGAAEPDSTIHHHDLSASDSGPASTSGIVGSARRFVEIGGAPMCVTDGDGSLEFDLGSFTYETWMQLQISLTGQNHVVLAKGATNSADAGFDLEASDSWVGNVVDDKMDDAEVTASAEIRGRWVYVALVVDRTQQLLTSYIDGAFTSSTTTNIVDSVSSVSEPFCLGGESDGTFLYRGDLDEVRIASVARSGDWLRFAGRNLANRDQVIAVGPQQVIAPN